MCRNKKSGGRRCSASTDPVKRQAYNAVRRQRYHDNKNSTTKSDSQYSFPDIIVNEDELFSEETVDTYSWGECYRLSNAIYRLGKENGYNWKHVAIVPDAEDMDDEWVHMSILTENGELLDIGGLNKHDAPYNEYTNAPFLQDRWEYSVMQKYSRKTGVVDETLLDKIQPKIVVIENDEHYSRLIEGQGQGAYTDDDAIGVAKHLITWYETKKQL